MKKFVIALLCAVCLFGSNTSARADHGFQRVNCRVGQPQIYNNYRPYFPPRQSVYIDYSSNNFYRPHYAVYPQVYAVPVIPYRPFPNGFSSAPNFYGYQSGFSMYFGF